MFHLAAYAAEGLSHFIRHFNYENNLVGYVNLINLAVNHNIKHFVFTSSIAVYGKNQLPMHEDLMPNPEDPYGISKLAVELDLKAAHEMWGLNYTIFRPHNVYGERQHYGDTYRNVLGIFINKIMKGESLPVFGDGKQTRAFSYVGDVAPYIAMAPDVPAACNQIINIGADKPYTILEMVEEVCKAAGVKPNLQFLPARKEVMHAHASHEKARRIFNITKSTPLREGVERMVRWAKLIGPLEGTKFKNIEIRANMPESWKKVTLG